MATRLPHQSVRHLLRLAGVMTLASGIALTAHAASSWSPTLLVNTESFQTIDEGDGSTDVEIRFGGSLNEKLYFNRTSSRFQFTDDLHAEGNLSASGTLSVDGTISTKANLTINADADSNNAVLTFGSDTTNETITWANTADRFEFSDDIRTSGNLSGSTLTIDGNVTIKGNTYSFPTGTAGTNTFLKNDGSGNLSWTTAAVSNGSGGIISLHPEYPNATYFSSGSSLVGQLVGGYDSSNLQNYYRWTSTKGSLQDYWVAIRVRLPNNFSSWDPVAPIQFRYRTGSASASNNYLTLRMLDTANSAVTLSGSADLANTSWTTASIVNTGGTYAAGGYLTLLLKVAANSSGSADAGFITLNFETTTP